MNKIEFYKTRNLGERFSAAEQFIRQNWKALCKIILIPAIPLVLVMGYFERQFSLSMNNLTVNAAEYQDLSEFFYDFGSIFSIYVLIISLFIIVIYALSATVMTCYEENYQNIETNLKKLSHKIFSNMKKVFLVNLAVGLLFVTVFAIFITLIAFAPSILKVFGIIILVLGIFAIFPTISLVFYPAIFQGTSIWLSVIKGIKIGFKNWGTTFVILLIAGIATSILSALLQSPYLVMQVINPGQTGIVPFILALLSSFAYVIVTPLSFIFLAFHYFSILEKEEGISLKSKIEQFDNL